MGEASKNEQNTKEGKPKVNGSVGRQALGSLGFSPVIPPPPPPESSLFIALRRLLTATATLQKNR